jgi:hypothetical protein
MPDITIAGMIFDLEPRYAPGHVLTEPEAHALNSAYRESVRNNFSLKVKAAREGGLDEDLIRRMFVDYIENFSFAARPPNRAPQNKVRQKAHEIAVIQIRQILHKDGRDWDEFDEHKKDAMIARMLERNPAIMEEAERQIALLRSQAKEVLGLIDDDDDES